MDIATLLGLIASMGIIGAAIVLGGDPVIFMNVPSILIVVGGAFGATVMRFSLKECFGGMAAAFGRSFKNQTDNPLELIELARHLADVARKKGLIALDGEDVPNALFEKGIQMSVDGHEPEVVREVLTNEINASITSNELGEKVFRAYGDAAPAFGMIGTLVGLVQMLANLSDPSAIGPAMAVALLTTLYGAMVSNMVFLPLADKLALKAEAEASNKSLIVAAVMGIQEGANPRVLTAILEAQLPLNLRQQEAAVEAE